MVIVKQIGSCGLSFQGGSVSALGVTLSALPGDEVRQV